MGEVFTRYCIAELLFEILFLPVNYLIPLNLRYAHT